MAIVLVESIKQHVTLSVPRSPYKFSVSAIKFLTILIKRIWFEIKQCPLVMFSFPQIQ